MPKKAVDGAHENVKHTEQVFDFVALGKPRKWKPYYDHPDPVKTALAGFTLAVIGTFVNVYEAPKGVWL